MMAKFSSEPTPRPPETTIFAEASSGRSEVATLSSTQDESPGSAAAGRGLDRRRGLRAGGLEAGAAHGDDLLRVGRLHGLDGVAGVDRPLEGVGRDDAGDVGDHHDVEQRRRRAGRRSCPRWWRGRRCARRRPASDDHEVGQGLGEAVAVAGALDVDHLRDAVELGRRLGDGAGVLAGDEHVDVAAHRLRGGDGLGGGVVEMRVVVLGENENGHQSTPASVLSLAISSSTEPTFTPALRVAGSAVLTTFRRGVTSTP